MIKTDSQVGLTAQKSQDAIDLLLAQQEEYDAQKENHGSKAQRKTRKKKKAVKKLAAKYNDTN